MQYMSPGFRFYPTEEELVNFYLRNKLVGKRPDIDRVIRVVNIYSLEPWELSKYSGELCDGDPEQWFFFVPRQEREAQGGRTNRTTASGYWKATGSPSHVFSSDNRVIGVKKSMVFYTGKAPTGTKTKWKMNEYRAIELVANPDTSVATPDVKYPSLRHEFSLCRVYVISGSFRAFDRRPMEVTSVVQRQLQASQNTAAMAEKPASLSEASEPADPTGGWRNDDDDWEMNERMEQTLAELEQEVGQWPFF